MGGFAGRPHILWTSGRKVHGHLAARCRALLPAGTWLRCCRWLRTGRIATAAGAACAVRVPGRRGPVGARPAAPAARRASGGCPQADEAILIASDSPPTRSCTAPPGTGVSSPCAPKSAGTASGSRWRTAEGRGVTGCVTTGGRTGSKSWRRSPGRGTGASTGTTAGASPGLGSAGEMRMAVLPPPADAARVSRFLADQPRWSIYWDKKYGLWRVAEEGALADACLPGDRVELYLARVRDGRPRGRDRRHHHPPGRPGLASGLRVAVSGGRIRSRADCTGAGGERTETAHADRHHGGGDGRGPGPGQAG